MKKKILIIEDEVSLLMALKEKFTQEGFDVFEAKDGEEGLKMIDEKKPDLVLLDLIMPIMDGITMLNRLRERGESSEVSVIILTNLGDERAVAESIRNGVTNYLVKTNWSLDDVVKKAREKLGM